MRSFLRDVKKTGVLPDSHNSHDHLNEQKDVPVDSALYSRWTSEFERIAKEGREKGEEIVWGFVDGFLLYWDKVRSQLHSRLSALFPIVPCRKLSAL